MLPTLQCLSVLQSIQKLPCNPDTNANLCTFFFFFFTAGRQCCIFWKTKFAFLIFVAYIKHLVRQPEIQNTSVVTNWCITLCKLFRLKKNKKKQIALMPNTHIWLHSSQCMYSKYFHFIYWPRIFTRYFMWSFIVLDSMLCSGLAWLVLDTSLYFIPLSHLNPRPRTDR